jgi:hypothetical protein
MNYCTFFELYQSEYLEWCKPLYVDCTKGLRVRKIVKEQLGNTGRWFLENSVTRSI